MWAVACWPGSARSIRHSRPTEALTGAGGGSWRGRQACAVRTRPPAKPYDSVVTMRDELENGGPESGRPPAVPPWAPPGPRVPHSDSVFAGQTAGARYGQEPPEPLPRSVPPPPRSVPPRGVPARRQRRGGRWSRLFLVIGLMAGLGGLVLSAGAAAIQFLPRSFSQAQRQQIMSWEVAKRWRTWPAGRIFPVTIGYELPGSAFGGGQPLPLQADRVGIATQATCRNAITRPVGLALAKTGCVAVLRATYQDTTQTLAVT